MKNANTEQLAKNVSRYLLEVLGILHTTASLPVGNQIDKDVFPYFLRDAFDLHRIRVLNTPVLLALDRNPDRAKPSEIRTWLQQISSRTDEPVVYVTDTLASYERRNLIRQNIPFVVPGTQLYLPFLGVDLREHFRRRHSTEQFRFSPSTQALLIAELLHQPWTGVWEPTEAASRLGYTTMTVSRTIREVVASGIAEVHKTGRKQQVQMLDSAKETWTRVAPYLRSPARRQLWTTHPLHEEPRARLASLSALSQQSLIADPQESCYAMLASDWKAIVHDRSIYPTATPETVRCELWTYTPLLKPESRSVDPLSLALTLRDSTDERVQMGVAEMLEAMPW